VHKNVQFLLKLFGSTPACPCASGDAGSPAAAQSLSPAGRTGRIDYDGRLAASLPGIG